MTKHPFIPDRPDFDPLTDPPSEALEPQPPEWVNAIKYVDGDLIGFGEISNHCHCGKSKWQKGDEIYFAEEWRERNVFGHIEILEVKSNILPNGSNEDMPWQPPSTMPQEIARVRWKVIEPRVKQDANGIWREVPKVERIER